MGLAEVTTLQQELCSLHCFSGNVDNASRTAELVPSCPSIYHQEINKILFELLQLFHTFLDFLDFLDFSRQHRATKKSKKSD